MCTGNMLHKLRLSKHMYYSDLSRVCKLPTNVLRGLENNYIEMCSSEIFCLAKAFNIPFLALCTNWREVQDCVEFRLEEMFEVRSLVDLKQANRKGYYIPNYTKIAPVDYKLKVLYDMSKHYRKDILGIKIDLDGINKRLGLTLSIESVKLSTVCELSFYKGLNLAYVIGGDKYGY